MEGFREKIKGHFNLLALHELLPWMHVFRHFLEKHLEALE